MSERQWLANVCKPEPGPSRAWAVSTFRVGRWSVGTDTLCLLAVNDRGRLAESPDVPSQVAAFCRKQLRAAPPSDAILTDANDLRRWCVWAEAARCGQCDGSGRYPGLDDFDCFACDGSGREDDFPARCGRLVGMPIDRRLLRKALPPELKDSPCRLWLTEVQSKTPAVVVDGFGEWRALVMTVDPSIAADDGYNLSRLPTYVAGVGVLWHLRNDMRGVLSDWLEERGLDVDEVAPVESPAGVPA